MSQLTNAIVTSARLTRSYGEMLLKDVTPAQFARLATCGGKPVQSNHAAFVYGHIALYPGRVALALGRADAVPGNPPKFDEVFKDGSPCLDDPAGAIYPTMDAVRAHYIASFDAAIKVIEAATDAELGRPSPLEGRMKEMFPTIADLANFLLSAHPMSHLGQVSAWRRLMGLPSAM